MRLARWLRRPIVWIPVSIALLLVVAWRSRLWDAGTSLGTVQPIPFFAAAALSAVIAVLWASRSADLLAATGYPVPVSSLVPMTAFANAINNVTPGSSGEILRAYLLRAHHGVDYAASGAVILIERLGALGFMIASGVLLWLTWVGVVAPVATVALVALLVAAPSVAYRTSFRPSGLVRALPLGSLVGPDRWARAASWLARVDDTVASVLTQPVRMATFAATTAGVFAVYTLQLMLVGQAIGVTLDPVAAWGALGLATTAGVLSMLPFGLGATDLALVALLGVAGVPPFQAGAMTFGYRLASTLPLGVAGVLAYAWLSARLPQADSGLGGSLEAARTAVAAERLPGER
jgi:uncharacterized protein (TIRG00374 family)